ILTTIARGLPAGTLDATGLRAHQLLARLARQFTLEETTVRERFNQLRRSKVESRTLNVEDVDLRPSTFDLRQLSPNEIELLEILVFHPELAPTALSDVADDDLTSPTARELFQTFRRLEEGGHALDFNAVLSEIEDPQLKHL